MKEFFVLAFKKQAINANSKEEAVEAMKAAIIDQLKNMTPDEFADSFQIGLSGVPKPVKKGFWDDLPIEWINDDNGKRAYKAKKFIDEFAQLVKDYEICINPDDHPMLESHTPGRCEMYIEQLRENIRVELIAL